MSDPILEKNAREYARRNAIELVGRLGGGTDGDVWQSGRQSAVKALGRQRNYTIERACYERFAEDNVTQIHGFTVPRLIGFDDALTTIEIEIVSPPFIIDFAKCRLDSPHDFSAEVMADWDEAGTEIFEDRWPKVKSLLRSLEQYGIYYLDAKPGNITFAPPDAEN
jgi:hypothetical protein